MTDIRARLPECPLEYEVPLIPGSHTAFVFSIEATDLDWQEKMLPWTLASLINNTDIVMQGVHLYIVLAPGIEGFRDRIQTALSRFDLPEGTITEDGTNISGTYDTIYMFDINHWAFRDHTNQIKLTIKDLFSLDLKPATPSEFLDLHVSPYLCNMEHATIEDFRRAIKHLMAAQLAMSI